MANTIIPKKSSVAAKVPLAADLAVGELAVNLVDQKLYSKKSDGTVILVGSGLGGAGDVIGAASSTDNAFVRFDGTNGKIIQNSTATLDDNGNASFRTFTATTVGSAQQEVGATLNNPRAVDFSTVDFQLQSRGVTRALLQGQQYGSGSGGTFLVQTPNSEGTYGVRMRYDEDRGLSLGTDVALARLDVGAISATEGGEIRLRAGTDTAYTKDWYIDVVTNFFRIFEVDRGGSTNGIERIAIDRVNGTFQIDAKPTSNNWTSGVSASSYGSVLDTGSNGNGRYVRYADGTMICWIQKSWYGYVDTGTTGMGDAINWTFPVSFVETPIVLYSRRSGWVYGYETGYERSSNTQVGNWYISNNGKAPNTNQWHDWYLSAIGRWK
jgi:hypothetical protein